MKILYLAPIPYDGMKQRPQYLADGLACENDVVYLEPTESRMKSLFRRNANSGEMLLRKSERLTVVRLNGAKTFPRMLCAVWRGFCRPKKKKLARYLDNVDLVWIGTCVWYPLVADYRGTLIYDKMDDEAYLAVNPLIRRLIRRSEPLLLKRANLLFVSARAFAERYAQQGLRPVLIPNAVDQRQALRAWKPAKQKDAGTRVYGYVGMISHWFDWEAIRAILAAAPENRVVLVGPQNVSGPEDSRITYIGAVSKSQIGAWIASFDVCLYPFQRSSLLNTINPAKIYEYLAQNKPVLAARSTEIDTFAPQVTAYESAAQLQALAKEALSPPFATEDERQAFVRANNWEERSASVERALANAAR